MNQLRSWHWSALKVISEPMSALARTSERDCRTRLTSEHYTAIESWTRTKYVYDDRNLIEEVNSSGAVVARYAQGLNLEEPLAMLRSSATSYYEQDGLGTATSLSNGAGSLAQTYTFDSFGKQTNSSGSLTNPFQYTGREFDSESNLYYMRARYFDPSTGRFISEDRIGFDGGENFYALSKTHRSRQLERRRGGS